MRQKTTSLRKNDRDILNAYTPLCLTDSIHSIQEVTAPVTARKGKVPAALRERQDKNHVNKNSH